MYHGSVSSSGVACLPCAYCGQSRPPLLQMRIFWLGALPERQLGSAPALGRGHGGQHSLRRGFLLGATTF